MMPEFSPKLRQWKVPNARKSLPVCLIRPATTRFFEMESSNINHLVLIPLGLARDAPAIARTLQDTGFLRMRAR
jgi:hypothetical protein